MRRITATLAAVITAALVIGTGAGTAAASPAAAAGQPVKEHGVAGYHVSLGKSITALTASAQVTVPRSSCGSGIFSPVVSAQFFVGKAETTASVALTLGCFGRPPVYGDAVLTVGTKTKNVRHPLKPGAVVTMTVTVRGSASSFSREGTAGRPAGTQFIVALPDPPGYSPVKFSACTVNGKKLAAFNPGAWESVTRSGKVNGNVSRLTDGKDFTVSE
jgi:hypothetical protein